MSVFFSIREVKKPIDVEIQTIISKLFLLCSFNFSSLVPTRYSSSKIEKEDFSFQWVISNCKKLQDWTATVRGPKIHSKNLPCLLSTSFADSTIIIGNEVKWDT